MRRIQEKHIDLTNGILIVPHPKVALFVNTVAFESRRAASSAIALKKYRTPEEIKRATMHSTNKAFERYFRIETEDLREIYKDTVGRGMARHMKGERKR